LSHIQDVKSGNIIRGGFSNWGENGYNYEIEYDHRNKCFEIVGFSILQDNTEYFKSRELAEKFIEQEIELLKKVFKIEGENEKI
jgi:hypothetical protein